MGPGCGCSNQRHDGSATIAICAVVVKPSRQEEENVQHDRMKTLIALCPMSLAAATNRARSAQVGAQPVQKPRHRVRNRSEKRATGRFFGSGRIPLCFECSVMIEGNQMHVARQVVHLP